MRKHIHLLIIALVVATLTINAQVLPNYSFYNLQQSIINPAAVASYDRFYAADIFRTQMNGFKGAPIGGLLDFGLPLTNTNFNIGGQVMYESIGVHDRYNIGAQLAYRVKLNLLNYLSFGITPYLQIVQTDFNNLNVLNTNDAQIEKGSVNSITPNFKAGAFFFRDDFYTGLSIGNLFSNNLEGNEGMTFRASYLHIYYNIGFSKQISTKWKFQPSAMLRLNGPSPLQVDFNAGLLYQDQFGFGLSYRTLHTFIAQVNYKFNNIIRIGYAFNYGAGMVTQATSYVGHEVFLSFTAAKPAVNQKHRIAVQVPRY